MGHKSVCPSRLFHHCNKFQFHGSQNLWNRIILSQLSGAAPRCRPQKMDLNSMMLSCAMELPSHHCSVPFERVFCLFKGDWCPPHFTVTQSQNQEAMRKDGIRRWMGCEQHLPLTIRLLFFHAWFQCFKVLPTNILTHFDAAPASG